MSEDRTAEIIRYVSAMAREFGEHRQEMRQFRHEFNQFREETNSRLGNVESRLGNVEGRLGNVEGQLGGLEEQFVIFKREQRQMSQLVSRIASAVIAAGADVEELRDRMTLLEGKGS